MKLQFEPDLPFQRAAIDAVCDVFEGQEQKPSVFTVFQPRGVEQLKLGAPASAHGTQGVGNRLTVLEDDLVRNLRRVQLRNGLRPSDGVDLKDLNITVEMETGTGKTYVYLRTIYELNQRYGFSKFLIVVPSIAIKAGVDKSLDIMRGHLGALYGNPPFNSFVYNSKEPGQVRGFATSPHIEVMVATIQALHKTDQRLFHQPTEKLGGDRPIDLIRNVRPIVIIDEPQSVEGGDQGKGREALREMNPLCMLRYSATHKDRLNMVYRLDAVDAYEQRLVKGIEVAAARVEGAHDRPFVRLLKVSRTGKTNLWAKIEVDCAGAAGAVSRQPKTVYDGDDLRQISRRPIYEDVRVGEIVLNGAERRVQLMVPGEDLWLAEGDTFGDVPADSLQQQMIRRTIRQHLDRELRLRPRGIKVLTLFFIDEVRHYRSYDDQGQPVMGKYAKMFEEEYRAAARSSDYQSLFEGIDHAVTSEVHDGYFSIDKKRRWVDTQERNQSGRAAAEAAYRLIMTDKEKLLSLSTPLKFIFSHSALKEGWDNPNVFQICSLREIGSERERRQKIGRGLRLCVNQDGRRVRDEGINRLTVIATESVEKFARELQKDIEKDTALRFNFVDSDTFASLPVLGEDGEATALGVDRSRELWKWLKAEEFIDKQGRVQKKLARALEDGSFAVPEAFEAEQALVAKLLRKLARGIKVDDADGGTRVKVRREVLDSPEFQALWGRIKHRTAYQVDFDPEDLITKCVAGMNEDAFRPGRARISFELGELEVDRGGVHALPSTQLGTPRSLQEDGLLLPDILTELQDRTGLTRRSIARILQESGQLWQFERSPQAFIKSTADVINRKKREELIDGIKYERLGDSEYYALTLFEDAELKAYIGENAVEDVQGKTPYEHIVYDSGGIEKPFAEFLEGAGAVRFFAKLPSQFKIPTPLGTYNPDWAVLVKTDEDDKLYFVIETKGSVDSLNLRGKEDDKIHCGRRHFAALSDVPLVARDGGAVQYEVATNGQDFMKYWGSDQT